MGYCSSVYMVTWRGVLWRCDVVNKCGVVWRCGVVWCDVVCSGVLWFLLMW